jgi:transposase-like protein
MASLARKRRKWKKKVSDRRKALENVMKLREIDDIDVRVSLIQALIPVGLYEVNKQLQQDVLMLAGEKHSRGKENVRWTRQDGSVYLLDQKVPVTVPRVRNKVRNVEVSLPTYQKLQDPHRENEQLFKRLLNGLSTHRYQECAELAPEVFGISASNLSKRFKHITAAKLEKLQERRLDNYDFVAIFVDGKRYADDGIVVTLGITVEGEKIVLGIEQMATENSRSMEQFFEHLKERGLRHAEGILFIIDGSKGLIKAIERVFKSSGIIHRCHYHKIENVVSYLPKGMQMIWRAKLREAYRHTGYEAAKRSLERLKSELHSINPSAERSLNEGMEETLSLHRLGLYAELGKSFSSTNCIESVMSQLGQYTDKVDRWRGGSHIQRWAAAGLLELEPRLRKIRGFRHLKLLKERLRQEAEKREKKQPLECDISDEVGVGIHQSTPEIRE